MERNFHAKSIIFGIFVGAFVIWVVFLITPSHSLNKARLLKIGMSKNDVVNLIGTPKRIEVSMDTDIQYEYWHYQGKISRDPYVCFVNDKVQSWHDM